MKIFPKKYWSAEDLEKDVKAVSERFSDNESELDSYISHQDWDNEESYSPRKNELLSDSQMSDWFVGQERILKKKKQFTVLYSVLAVSAVVTFFWLFGGKLLQSEDVNNNTLDKTAMQVFENSTQQEAPFFLPDGTKAMLSPGSKLVLARAYGAHERRLQLYGNALFYVKKDPLHRFVVVSGNIYTTALGTIFRVNNLQPQKIVVQLLEGKILVKEQNNDSISYYLLPGKTLTYESAKHRFNVLGGSDLAKATFSGAKNKMDEDVVTGFKSESAQRSGSMASEGIVRSETAISFKDVDLSDVLPMLASQFNVKIYFPVNKMAGIKFVGNIDKKQNIRKLLSDIAIMNSFKLDVDSTGGVFRFY